MCSRGAPSVFSGAMANPVTRYATEIEVIADAAFTVLEFQFDGGETEQVGPATIASYPALFKLEAVKSFKLASGSIIAYFGHSK
jgi:hypothetical protein